MMADVFISYSQKDAALTGALAANLKDRGYKVWWDTRLIAGQRFDDVIREMLINASAVIVVWTPESVKSDYVRMEAGIGWAWEKLIPVRVADLSVKEVPGPFQDLQTDNVTDVERIVLALEAMDIKPQRVGANTKLSKEQIISALAAINASLPASVEAWLKKCQNENFRIVVKKSIMVKYTIPNFGKINFCTLFPDGTFQTNYISYSADLLGDPSIAADYLNGVAGLIEGASVLREGKSWTWRVEIYGALPSISSVLVKGDEWIGLMKAARKRFTEVAAARCLER